MGSREDRPLVGRDRELRTIAAALEEARAGRGRVIVLSGEPGIGKTRLADEIASIAQNGGFAVAWGRCWEADGVPPPYLPWAQIFRAYRLDPQLAAAVASRASELAAIVPELGTGARFGEDARFRVLDAVASALATGANAKPLLVVVDDAHAADPPSLHALHFCARNVRTMRAVLLVTARDVAANPVPEAATLLHKIGREGDRIALRRLSIAEVERWIAQREPARAASLAEDVHRVT